MVCERMGWTYEDLQNTPEDFLQALYARLEVESDHQKAQQQEMERKMASAKKARHRH